MNYIGIDWGLRKIGIAYGEEETGMAFPVGTEKNDADFFEKLCVLLTTYEADQFVIGYSENDQQNDNREAILAFAKKLEVECGNPVVFAEEMFSTRQAHQNLKAAGHKNIGAKDDAEAARIILQNYLDEHRDS